MNRKICIGKSVVDRRDLSFEMEESPNGIGDVKPKSSQPDHFAFNLVSLAFVDILWVSFYVLLLTILLLLFSRIHKFWNWDILWMTGKRFFWQSNLWYFGINSGIQLLLLGVIISILTIKSVYISHVFLGSTIFFMVLWLVDPSILSTISLIGLTLTISDYMVPMLARSFFKSDVWTTAKEEQFEEVCRTIVVYREKMRLSCESFLLLRTTKPKLVCNTKFFNKPHFIWSFSCSTMEFLLWPYAYWLGLVMPSIICSWCMCWWQFCCWYLEWNTMAFYTSMGCWYRKNAQNSVPTQKWKWDKSKRINNLFFVSMFIIYIYFGYNLLSKLNKRICSNRLPL